MEGAHREVSIEDETIEFEDGHGRYVWNHSSTVFLPCGHGVTNTERRVAELLRKNDQRRKRGGAVVMLDARCMRFPSESASSALCIRMRLSSE